MDPQMLISNVAGGRPQNSKDQAKHCALPTTALAQNNKPVPRKDFQVNSVENRLVGKAQNDSIEVNERSFVHLVYSVTTILYSDSHPLTLVFATTTLSEIAL